MVKRVTSDVDIDILDRSAIVDNIPCVFGCIERDGKLHRHPSGIYLQNIPRDPTTNIATLDHRIASEFGYFKIDFLNVSMYQGVKSEQHLLELMNREPDWELFTYAEITDNLFHLNGKSYLLQRFPPRSVEDLAIILALIRPSKAYLQASDWATIEREVWTKTDDNYQFKRSHSIGYALAVVVHMNLYIEQLESVVPAV